MHQVDLEDQASHYQEEWGELLARLAELEEELVACSGKECTEHADHAQLDSK